MGLLGRARKMFQGMGPAEPARAQYYRVACPEGHVLRGLRTEGYQALRCPSCGEGVFVLPRSPLPDPPAPPSDRPRKKAASAVAADEEPIALTDAPPQIEPDAEIEWLDPDSDPGPVAARAQDPAEVAFLDQVMPAPAAPAPAPARPQPPPLPPDRPARAAAAAQDRAQRAARPRPKGSPRAEVAPEEAGPPKVVVAPGPSLAERLRRNKPAVVLVAVVLVIAGTVSFKMWRERRQNLPRLAELNYVEGMEAMEKGEFSTAKEKLARAARGFRELRDEKTDKVRHLAEESAIYADQLSKSVEELLDEAAYIPSEEWASRFKTHYKGRSVVIDADIESLPDGAGKGYELDYIIIGEGKRAKSGRFDLTGFKLLDGTSLKKGDRVLFGARLASVTLGERDQWQFALDPDSGVWLSDAKALKVVLPPPEDEQP